MHKQIVPLVICLFIVIFYSINQVEGSNEKELEKLFEVAKKNDITITSWRGYIKTSLGEAKNIKELNKIVESAKDSFPFVKEWTSFDEKSHHFTVKGKVTNISTNQLIEQIQIYAYNSYGTYSIFLTIEIKGKKWDKESYTSVITDIKSYIDVEKEFYTVEGLVYNKIELNKTAEHIMEDLEANYIEGINEGEFLSISGYTPTWQASITSSDNQNINVQVGLRYNPNLNRTKITIGTPIIVTEY